MKRYRLNSIAKSDLTSIHKYIARDNLTAADGLILDIKQKFRLLASQPLLGHIDQSLAPASVRSQWVTTSFITAP